eukprot:Ihof_evm9s169 gene=Ihof_evmTU9s169
MGAKKRIHSDSEEDFISFGETDEDAQGTKRRREILCFGCGLPGHTKSCCPNKANPDTEDGRHARQKKEREKEEDHNKKMSLLHTMAEMKKDRGAPWVARKYSDIGIIALHQEILDYMAYMRPTPEEESMRQDLIDRITSITKKEWPRSKLDVFGSYRTCLYTPSSDIDVVLFGDWPRVPLRTLANKLRSADMADDEMRVIENARVPIIKFKDVLTGIDVDIAFNQPSGPSAADIIEGYIEEYPCLLPLVLVLKQFLAQRKLNEPFTGGIGSYSLVVMVVSFLQLHPRISNQAATANMNLGVLLMEFFEVYGRIFEYNYLGISILNRGSFFYKADRRWNDIRNPEKISLEDPQRTDNDISGGSFSMHKIKKAFQHAYDILQQSLLDPDFSQSPTALSAIITLAPEIGQARLDRQNMWRRTATAKSRVRADIPK